RICTAPAACAAAFTAFGSVTSSKRVSQPVAFASSASNASLMSVAITRAPSRTKASAVARPMPWPAAVTKASLPLRRCGMGPVAAPGQMAAVDLLLHQRDGVAQPGDLRLLHVRGGVRRERALDQLARADRLQRPFGADLVCARAFRRQHVDARAHAHLDQALD